MTLFLPGLFVTRLRVVIFCLSNCPSVFPSSYLGSPSPLILPFGVLMPLGTHCMILQTMRSCTVQRIEDTSVIIQYWFSNLYLLHVKIQVFSNVFQREQSSYQYTDVYYNTCITCHAVKELVFALYSIYCTIYPILYNVIIPQVCTVTPNGYSFNSNADAYNLL